MQLYTLVIMISCVFSLCRSQWRHVSAYRQQGSPGFSFKKLYMQLDEATLTFNADVSLVTLLFLNMFVWSTLMCATVLHYLWS